MSDRDDKKQSESAVERYTRSPAGTEPETASGVEHMGESYDREAISRGPALSLNLLLKNDNSKTVEYAHRVEMDFDPELGVEMYFSTGLKVSIKGLHLRQLYEDLALHRVLRIRSHDELHAFSKVNQINGQQLPVVTEIVIERGRLDVDTGLWQAAHGNWSTDLQVWVPRTQNMLN